MNDTNDTATDNRPDYEVARDELRALVASLNLGAVVSPASGAVDNEKDHEGKPRAWVHLLYTITVRGQVFEYRMGEGHVPWDRVKEPPYGPVKVDGKPVRNLPESSLSLIRTRLRNAAARFSPSYLKEWADVCAIIANAAKVAPDVGEVLGCVARDAEAMHQTFPDWCAEYGYDDDSRKAEAVYNACLEGGRKLRAFLTPDTIAKLAELSARL